jgi:hypothetical protein
MTQSNPDGRYPALTTHQIKDFWDDTLLSSIDRMPLIENSNEAAVHMQYTANDLTEQLIVSVATEQDSDDKCFVIKNENIAPFDDNWDPHVARNIVGMDYFESLESVAPNAIDQDVVESNYDNALLNIDLGYFGIETIYDFFISESPDDTSAQKMTCINFYDEDQCAVGSQLIVFKNIFLNLTTHSELTNMLEHDQAVFAADEAELSLSDVTLFDLEFIKNCLTKFRLIK